MKKYIILLILILSSCSEPNSCPGIIHNSDNGITTTIDGKLYTGRCMTYENEIKRSIQQYVNGKDYGKWTFYFPNGTIETKGRFNKLGKRTGKWKYYYENGQLKQVSKYSKKGERSGKWKKYNEQGDLIEVINY
jgi:antitoxin component YwqK of YwqJK toxin-antitoxin module